VHCLKDIATAIDLNEESMKAKSKKFGLQSMPGFGSHHPSPPSIKRGATDDGDKLFSSPSRLVSTLCEELSPSSAFHLWKLQPDDYIVLNTHESLIECPSILSTGNIGRSCKWLSPPPFGPLPRLLLKDLQLLQLLPAGLTILVGAVS
jgi:hypothetical protein